jgi:SAM-dependent methyltransferase
MTWENIYLTHGRVQLSPMKVVTLLSQRLNKNQAYSVLDVGCGTGRHSLFLAKELPFSNFSCFDNAPSSISLLRESVAEYPDRERFECMVKDIDDSALDFNRDFDVVICTLLIHHGYWSDIQKRLIKLNNWLKVGGSLVLAVLADKDPRIKTGYEVEPLTRLDTAQLDGDVPHHFFSEVELLGALATYKIIFCEAVEKESVTSEGNACHWEVLAEKKIVTP